MMIFVPDPKGSGRDAAFPEGRGPVLAATVRDSVEKEFAWTLS